MYPLVVTVLWFMFTTQSGETVPLSSSPALSPFSPISHNLIRHSATSAVPPTPPSLSVSLSYLITCSQWSGRSQLGNDWLSRGEGGASSDASHTYQRSRTDPRSLSLSLPLSLPLTLPFIHTPERRLQQNTGPLGFSSSYRNSRETRETVSC